MQVQVLASVMNQNMEKLVEQMNLASEAVIVNQCDCLKQEEMEYKANVLPVGQSTHQPEKYDYGIKKGTTFYFNINTKGIKNKAIAIVPRFFYVSPEGKECKDPIGRL